MNTLSLLLRRHGLRVQRDGLALTLEQATTDEVWEVLREVQERPAVEGPELAAAARTLLVAKHDRFLTPDLLCHNYAAGHLDVPGAYAWLHQALKANI